MRSRRREPTARSARPRPAKPPPTKLAVPIPTFWKASALWPATHRRSPLRRSTTPTTRHRWRRCETPWATSDFDSAGPRARRCPPTRRSPTRSAAAANASDPPAAGLTDADRTRRRTSGQRRAGQQRHRRKAFRLTPHRANPPHPRLLQTRPHLTRTARAGSGPPQLKHRCAIGGDLRVCADVLRSVVAACWLA